MPRVTQETINSIRQKLQSIDSHNIDVVVIDAIEEIVLPLAAEEYDKATGGDPAKPVFEEGIFTQMQGELEMLRVAHTPEEAQQKIEKMRNLLTS